MIDVSHNNDDRSAADKILFLVFMVVNETLLNRYDHFLLDLAAELHCDKRGSIIVDDVGYGCEHSELYELLYYLSGSLFHA